MLHPERKKPKQMKGFRMSEHAAGVLAQLAQEYAVSEAKIIDAMLTQYGPKLLEQVQRAKQEGTTL